MSKKVIVPFLISAFFLGFLPIKDTDFGWHYRCGKELIESAKLCTANRFSYFLANYKAYNPSFLYDTFISIIYDRFGFLGLSFAGAIIFTLAALLIFCLFNCPAWLSTFAFYIIWILSEPIFNSGLRSQILTYLFFLILLLILERAKKNPKLLFLLPILLFIWVNSHIGFFVGLVIIAFYLFQNRSRIIMAGFLLSFIATLVNPFGVNVYKEIINHAFSPLNKMIAEWVPPPSSYIVLILVSSILLLVKLADKKKTPFFKILLLVFFALLSIKARRNLPFFYTVFFYIFLKQFNVANFTDKIGLPKEIQHKLFLIFIPVVLIFILIPQFIASVNFDRFWDDYCSRMGYPCQALKHYPSLKGNVYTAYEWGGFLIWQNPKSKVFVDGRMPAWKDKNGKSPYQVYLEIIQAREGWNLKLTSLKTDYLLIQTGTFLDLLLEKDAEKFGWEQQYRDKTATIYKWKVLPKATRQIN